INAISGERCSPHPHNFTDRIIRPGDQAFFDIIMSFVGYRTCYYRTFSVGRATKPQIAAYKKAREWMDEAIALTKPGVATDKIARAFPKAHEIGFDSEMAAFGLNFCHGIGLGLHERPIISRLNSFDDPMELQAGMMFAVETYCPATDGMSAARIEEEGLVTPSGAQFTTLSPADELPLATRYCPPRGDTAMPPATLVSLLATAFLLAAGDAAAQGPIRIGFISPLTGAIAAAGKDMYSGCELYWQESGWQMAGPKVAGILVANEGNPALALPKPRHLLPPDQVPHTP